MSGSFQNEIPAARINLKLDVGKGDAKKKIELPMKLLVMGDFTGQEKEKRISEREKICINKENFGRVMESMNLKVDFAVENKLSGQGDLRVSLEIKDMDSFKPGNVAGNVPALSRLLAARNLLKDLKSNLLDNREFRKRLEEILRTPASMKLLQEQLQKIVPEAQEQPA
ncbi:MAG: type VI secretion system contractile sheath small subunit [Fibrobacter sp.]|mgnify:CR=1 FL=1|nr:type VI secretion system contractile sheath small subunit [Fibrobacter sp.]